MKDMEESEMIRGVGDLSVISVFKRLPVFITRAAEFNQY